MTDEEIKKWLEDNTQVRPYNENGEKDGNWNFIHRIAVSLLISKLRSKKS